MPEAPAFKEVNIVYGYNGCGKTTLTRLFDRIETGAAGIDIGYDVENSDGGRFDENAAFPFPIRVFNSDYISNNVRLLENKANAISIVLGAKNKDLSSEIEKDELYLNGDPKDADKPGAIYEWSGQTKKLARIRKESDDLFTGIAKTIGAVVGGAALRTYRSPQAKADFAKVAGGEVISTDELNGNITILKQEMLDPIASIDLRNGVENERFFEEVEQAVANGRGLCAKTATSKVIERLKLNGDIAGWVEQGLEIHAKHGSTKCEYCASEITPARIALLAEHFSDADKALKSEIDAAISRLRAAYGDIRGVAMSDPARIYGELRPEYQVSLDDVQSRRAKLLGEMAVLGKKLQDKKLHTTEELECDDPVDWGAFQASMSATNALIARHNEKSAAFKALQNAAVDKIKMHYLASIYQEVSSKKLEIEKLEKSLAKLADGISSAKAKIEVARAAISSAHRGCEEINTGLRTFLGRDEFRFESELKVAEGGSGGEVVGYRIVRGDKPATHLSEGEKTAIAFVYFVVHLSDGVFKKSDGIVVIDDPISSLDSNSLYQAFSFLKNAVKGCKQAFILTHNFDFLKLLLNWRSQGRRPSTGLYMIRNVMIGDVRRAKIELMEKELRDYESEYHYLFKTLKEMRRDQDGSIMRAYPVPNVARKVWETFLLYCLPTGESSYKKFERLKLTYDPTKLDAIYKFTNDNSHVTGAGFNPALVPETQNVLAHLFEMMKAIAPTHFDMLDGATPLN